MAIEGAQLQQRAVGYHSLSTEQVYPLVIGAIFRVFVKLTSVNKVVNNLV